MLSYFVRYHGTSPSPDGFFGRYETRHAEILRRFPKMRSLIVHRPADWTDPFPVKSGGTFFLAQMVFDRPGDLELALRSPARAEAREDFHRFPPFSGAVTHEAMRGKVIF